MAAARDTTAARTRAAGLLGKARGAGFQLTEAEGAFLAAVMNAPSLFDPHYAEGNQERAEERFDGLTQLLHTLRSPDVGNRIDEGRLPALLSDALPPLSQTTLDAAGAKLDEISETRALQERLERGVTDLDRFLTAYRRYAQGELAAATGRARAAVRDRTRADRADATARQAAADFEARQAAVQSRLESARTAIVDLEREQAASRAVRPAPAPAPASRATLMGISPQLLPRPADWPATVHLTGAWHAAADGQSGPAAARAHPGIGRRSGPRRRRGCRCSRCR